MRNGRRVMVVKRGGGLEPFDAAKLRRCLAAAMKDSRCDGRFAEALARAVELHLREWSEPRPPTTEYVFRCVRTALQETGMKRVAQRLTRQRRERAARRQSVSVFEPGQPDDALLPWRKAAVAGTLEHLYGLKHAVARILAGEIEQRVLGLGFSVVSTALIAELTRNELLAWGLMDAAAATGPRAGRRDVAAGRESRKEC